MNFPELVHVKALEKYRLQLSYSDGTSGILDLSELSGHGVFEWWDMDDNFFKVSVDPVFKSITWSDDLDICPNTAYLQLKGLSFDEWKTLNSSHAAA